MLINDLTAHIKMYQEQLKHAVTSVIESGWLILGPQVKQFEREFASYNEAEHCISLANGTDAIELALKAMGVCSGDRVGTAANAGMYTSTALLALGAEPFYMDVDLESNVVTLNEVRRAVDAGVKAIVATHLYGLAIPEIMEIAALCKQENIKLLEDCAQAHGARLNGRFVGTFGDAASFSFYPTKNLGALGDGGAVITNNPDILEMVMRLRQYGWTSKYKVELAGARNSRLDEMQAAILSVFLPNLDTMNQRRREIATHYSKSIRHPLIKTPLVHGEEYVAHLYIIRSEYRESLRKHLEILNIGTDIHYPIPDYRQPVFGNRFLDFFLPNSEILAREVLTLPCYPEMTDEQVEQVVNSVNTWRQ